MNGLKEMVHEGHVPSKNEEKVLDVLKEGRGTGGPWGYTTPSRVAEEHELPRQRVNEALDRLVSAGWIEHVEVDGQPIRGLYRFVEDPRGE